MRTQICIHANTKAHHVPLTAHLCSRGRRWANLSSLREMLTKVLPLKTLLFNDDDQTDGYSSQAAVGGAAEKH